MADAPTAPAQHSSSGDGEKTKTKTKTGTGTSAVQVVLIIFIVAVVAGIIAAVVGIVMHGRNSNKEEARPVHPCDAGFTHAKCTPADLHKYCTANHADKNIQAKCSQHCRQTPTLYNHCAYESACRDLEYPTPAESVALFANCRTCVPYADKLQFCNIAEFEQACTADPGLCGEYCLAVGITDPRFATCAAICPAMDSENCFAYCLAIDTTDPRFPTCVEYCKHVPDACAANCNSKGLSPLSPHLNSVCKMLRPTLLENALVNIMAWLIDGSNNLIAPAISRGCAITSDEPYLGDVSEPCSGAPIVYGAPDHVWRTADVEYEQFIAPNGEKYDTWLCTIATTNPDCSTAPFLGLGEQVGYGLPIVFVPNNNKIRFRLVSVGDCRYMWTNVELTHFFYISNVTEFTNISDGNGPSHPDWQANWDWLVKERNISSVVLTFVE
jgi:hypothetical protein